MKILVKSSIALMFGAMAMTSAQANNNYMSNSVIDSNSINPYYADGYTGQAYLGIKGGIYNAYGDGVNDEAKNPATLGLYGGYHFDRSFGVEVEYVDSAKGNYDAKTYGAYGTYRYYMGNEIYAKGKLGLANSEVESNGFKTDGTEIAGGLGIGYQVAPNVDLEGEYSRVLSDSDTNINVDALTVGARIKF